MDDCRKKKTQLDEPLSQTLSQGIGPDGDNRSRHPLALQPRKHRVIPNNGNPKDCNGVWRGIDDSDGTERAFCSQGLNDHSRVPARAHHDDRRGHCQLQSSSRTLAEIAGFLAIPLFIYKEIHQQHFKI